MFAFNLMRQEPNQVDEAPCVERCTCSIREDGPGAFGGLAAALVGCRTSLAGGAGIRTSRDEQGRRNGHHTNVCHGAGAYTGLSVACNG